MAVGSLVLGIVGIVFSFIFQPIGLICSIVGLILSIVARKKEPSGMATAGLVCSIIGLVLNLILVIACGACIGAAGAGASWLNSIS